MKQFLLFAGGETARANGVNGFVADFDSTAEAFLSLVDHQTPSRWWHILDTQTGEVIERRHIQTSKGAIGFLHSDRIAGSQTQRMPLALLTARDLDGSGPEADLRRVMTPGHPGADARGTRDANGPANGTAPEH